jgi:hypothetical protein
MTQSKDDDITITIANDIAKDLQSSIDNSIIIDLNSTYGATTTYQWSSDVGNISITGNSPTGVYIDSSGSSYTIGTNDTIDLGNIIWGMNDNTINPDEVAKMCKEYPALEKVWDNFKSVYDMVKQDYEGKKKVGEVDE